MTRLCSHRGPVRSALRTVARVGSCVLVFAATTPAAAADSPAVSAAQPTTSAEAAAYARVTVTEVEVRSAPTSAARVLYVARRGEVLGVDRRASSGYWLRLTLPDGREGYAVGDQLLVFAGDAEAATPLAPSPLAEARAGFTVQGGALRTTTGPSGASLAGYFELKASAVLHDTLTLDAYLGAAKAVDGLQVFYGAGASLYFAPTWRVSPYFSLAAGGFSVRPNADNFVLQAQTLYAARATFGLLAALKGRLLLQASVSNLTLFNTASARNAQLILGGIGVYF